MTLARKLAERRTTSHGKAAVYTVAVVAIAVGFGVLLAWLTPRPLDPRTLLLCVIASILLGAVLAVLAPRLDRHLRLAREEAASIRRLERILNQCPHCALARWGVAHGWAPITTPHVCKETGRQTDPLT